MENNDKIFDSPADKDLGSKFSRDQAWAKLTSEYLQDLPNQIKELRDTLEARDYDAIKKYAHRIKGTSGTYRLDSIFNGAAQLERVAESKNPDAIASAINKIMRLVEQETSRFDSGLVSSFDDSERNTNG